MRRAGIIAGVVALGAVLTGAAAHAQTPECVGDCNGDKMVLVNELITGVNIVLGLTPLSACEAFDADGDGNVGINELVIAVNNALNGCDMTPDGVERVFVIEPGQPQLSANDTRTGLFTGALFNSNAALDIPAGPLTIVMGERDENGIAPLTLKEDVDMSITVLDSSCLCMRLLAQGTVGSIDCDGGTAYDTMAVRPNNAGSLAWTVTTGLGEPSGPGNANLLVQVLFERVQSSCEIADCPNRTYTEPANVFAFTTTTATAIQETNTNPLTLSDPGAPFNCDTFMMPNGAMLAAPAPTTIDPVGEVANVFRFAEALPQ